MRRVSLIMLPAAVLLLIGCATTPVRPSGDFFMGMMPEDSTLLLKVDVRENRELSERLLVPMLGKESLPPDLLKRTDTLYAGISPSNALLPEIAFTVVGNFPAGIIKATLNDDKAWERRKNGSVYWKSVDSPMELAVPDRGVICGTTGSVRPMVEHYENRRVPKLPMEVRREFDVSDVVVFMPKPGADTFADAGAAKGTARLRGADIPISALWLTLLDHGETYELSLVFQVENPDTTRKLALVSRLLVLGIVREAELGNFSQVKDDVSITEQDTLVRLEGLRLSVTEIEKLLSSFLPAP